MSADGGLTPSVSPAGWSGWGLHPALWRLLRLQWGARWRSMRRQMRTVRGASVAAWAPSASRGGEPA